MLPYRDENQTLRRPHVLVQGAGAPQPLAESVCSLGLARTTLPYWAGLQVLSGLASIGDASAGVAFWAHVGGFATGMVLAKPFSRKDRVAAHEAQHWRPKRILWQ